MPRSALRAPFVVTFALSAATIASGCGGKDAGNASNGDGGSVEGGNGDGTAACPAKAPMNGEPCDTPMMCTYDDCYGSPSTYAECQAGRWFVSYGSCNPPAVYDASPPVDDAGPNVHDAGADGDDGGPDGEGQDGGHD